MQYIKMGIYRCIKNGLRQEQRRKISVKKANFNKTKTKFALVFVFLLILHPLNENYKPIV